MESVSGKNLTDLLRPQSENADLKIRWREFSLLFSPGGALLLFPLEAEEFQSKGWGRAGNTIASYALSYGILAATVGFFSRNSICRGWGRRDTIKSFSANCTAVLF